MLYDNSEFNQPVFYNGQSGVTPYYNSVNNGGQPQQIQVFHVHCDVNQLVNEIFDKIMGILDYKQSNGGALQPPNQVEQKEPGTTQLPAFGYMAVYSYNGFGVFDNMEKLKQRTKSWGGDYELADFSDYNSAMSYARSGIARIRNVPVEAIPDNKRLNWMCYMK